LGGSFVSRRVSEFVGVALFALALMWLISLASYTPADPVWFFTTGADGAVPLNFGGRVGAFLAELSYQMLGYSAYLLPIVLVVSGWHYFWCRTPDAAYTKLVGAALLFACVSSFLSLAFGTLRVANREILAGGYLGRGLAALIPTSAPAPVAPPAQLDEASGAGEQSGGGEPKSAWRRLLDKLGGA